MCPILPLCHLSAALFTSYFTFLALSVIFLSPLLLNSLFPLPPLSLSLLPLSSVPRGYYLSRRQICPIINLISSFSFSQPLQLPRSSPQFYRHTEAKAGKNTFPLLTHTHFLFLSHCKKPIMHTSSLLPSFSPFLPSFLPLPHWSGTNNN